MQFWLQLLIIFEVAPSDPFWNEIPDRRARKTRKQRRIEEIEEKIQKEQSSTTTLANLRLRSVSAASTLENVSSENTRPGIVYQTQEVSHSPQNLVPFVKNEERSMIVRFLTMGRGHGIFNIDTLVLAESCEIVKIAYKAGTVVEALSPHTVGQFGRGKWVPVATGERVVLENHLGKGIYKATNLKTHFKGKVTITYMEKSDVSMESATVKPVTKAPRTSGQLEIPPVPYKPIECLEDAIARWGDKFPPHIEARFGSSPLGDQTNAVLPLNPNAPKIESPITVDPPRQKYIEKYTILPGNSPPVEESDESKRFWGKIIPPLVGEPAVNLWTKFTTGKSVAGATPEAKADLEVPDVPKNVENSESDENVKSVEKAESIEISPKDISTKAALASPTLTNEELQNQRFWEHQKKAPKGRFNPNAYGNPKSRQGSSGSSASQKSSKPSPKLDSQLMVKADSPTQSTDAVFNGSSSQEYATETKVAAVRITNYAPRALGEDWFRRNLKCFGPIEKIERFLGNDGKNDYSTIVTFATAKAAIDAVSAVESGGITLREAAAVLI